MPLTFETDTYIIDIPNHSFFDCAIYIIHDVIASIVNHLWPFEMALTTCLVGINLQTSLCRKDPQRWVSWNAANGDSCSCLHFWSPWSVSFTLSWTNEKRHISKERPSLLFHFCIFYAEGEKNMTNSWWT